MLAMGDTAQTAERSQPNGMMAPKAKDVPFPMGTANSHNGGEEKGKVSSATSIDYSDRNPIETPTKTTTDQKKTDDKSPRSQQQPNDDSDLTEQQQQLSPNCPLRRSTRVSILNAKKQTQQNERTESERSADSATKDNDDELEMVQEHRTGGDAVAVSRDMEVNEHASTLSQQQCVSSLKRKLKRKLEDGQELDQYDCKFGIRLDPEGDVVMMSDESEISSLNEADVTDLRERYENTQRQEVPKEVVVQREMQIRELESILRLEEAKLMMLKKLQQSQQKAAQKTQQQQQQNQQQQQQQENVRRLAPGVVQNSTGQAYKPKVAVVNPSQHQTGNTSKTNGTTPQHGKKGSAKSDTSVLQNGAGLGAALGGVANSGASIQLASLPPQHQQVIQQLYTRLSQNPPQLAQMIKTLPHSTGQALTELLRQYAVAQASNIQPAGSGQIQNSSAAAASAKFAQQLQSSVSSQAIAQAQVDAAHKQARELTQQKIASARQQLRKELDVMIMKLPAPKAPPPDLQFIPNGNQPDFCYLLGLDLTVQRVLKDKTMFRKADFSPYQCEECETDFTPSWKAICGEQEDYHLYCERCIRQAQKRKVRQDYSALLKRAFQQVQEREKEFERQVLAGKFNVEPVMPTPPTIAPTQQQTTTTTTNTGVKQHNIQTAVSTHCQPTSTPKGVPSSSAASLQQFSQQHNASAALNLSKSGAASANAMATVTSTAKGQHISSAQSAKSASAKRTSSTATAASSSSSATMANPLAALAQNPQLQQQFAAMASITNNPLFRQVLSNPMFAAAMTNNPMQLYAALAATQQQRTQQQQQSAQNPANVSGAAAGNAMAALIQAVQQSVHQQQQQNRTSNASTVVTSNNSSSANPPPAVSSSSTANSIAQQMQAMAAFASNPMLALQSQLSQMGAGGAANANVQLLSQLNNNPQLLRQFQQMYMAQQQMKAGTGGGKK